MAEHSGSKRKGQRISEYDEHGVGLHDDSKEQRTIQTPKTNGAPNEHVTSQDQDACLGRSVGRS